MYHKNFENQFKNENQRPKMILNWYFTCAREVIQKFQIKNSYLVDVVQACGPYLNISLYLALIYSI